MTRLFPSLFSPTATSHGTKSETKPHSSASDNKRLTLTIQEIVSPRIDIDLEEQRPDSETYDNDLRKQPFSFVACTQHDSSEAVHLTTIRAPPTTASSKSHSRKASLPERVARWRESQGQKNTATLQAAQQPQQQQQQQQQKQNYPNNDSTKNLLAEEDEAMLPAPERSLLRNGH
jgi:hypothetical protein